MRLRAERRRKVVKERFRRWFEKRNNLNGSSKSQVKPELRYSFFMNGEILYWFLMSFYMFPIVVLYL